MTPRTSPPSTSTPPKELQTTHSRRGRYPLNTRLAPWLFTTPAILLTSAFIVIPLGYTAWLSLHGTRIAGGGLGVREEVFVGLKNYAAALADSDLLAGFGRMLLYSLIAVPTTMGLALLFALLLDNASTKFARFSRISIFIPYAVPGVIAALMWGFLYLPGVSPFTAAARWLELPQPQFLGSDLIYLSVANVTIWGAVGFNTIILYTSLRALPSEIYDAARVDGCSEIRLAVWIKIPLIVPGLVMTGLFSIIGALQVFNEPNTLLTLTNVIGSDWVPMMLVYRNAFITNDLHSAATISVLVTIITVAASLVLLRSLQRRAFGEQ